jgi:hypothetical protein
MKKENLLALLFLVMLVSMVSSQLSTKTSEYFRRDMCVFTQRVGTSDIALVGISKSFRGYQTISISTNKTNPSGGLVFKIYYGSRPQIDRHVPNTKNFQLTDQIITNDDGLRLSINFRDYTTRPYLSYMSNPLYAGMILNGTLFYSHFGVNVSVLEETRAFWKSAYIHMGVNTESKPRNATIFSDAYTDDMLITGNDLRSGYYSIQYENRLELLHPAIFFSVIPFYIIILILSIVFSRAKPLKLHGVIPILSAIYQLLNILLLMPQLFVDLETFTKLCPLRLLVTIPAQVSLVTMIPIFQAKNLILWNLNSRKSIYVESKTEESKEKLRFTFRLLKFINLPFVELIFSFFFAFLFILIGFILYAVPMGVPEPFVCEEIKTAIHNYFQIAYMCVVIFIIFCLFLLDMFFILKKIIRQKSLFILWKEDVFYLRFQIYIVGLLFTVPVFALIAITSTVYSFLKTLPELDIIVAVLVSIGFFNLFATQTLFVLAVTIFKFFFVRLRICCMFGGKTINQQDFAYALMQKQNFELRNIFKTYAESEFSVENLICFEDIQQYKKLKTFVDKQRKATVIYHTYLNGDASELEINVVRKICKVSHFSSVELLKGCIGQDST